jgi:hypothetical protein
MVPAIAGVVFTRAGRAAIAPAAAVTENPITDTRSQRAHVERTVARKSICRPAAAVG